MSQKAALLEHELERHRRTRQYDQMVLVAKKISKAKGDASGSLEAFINAEIQADKLLSEFERERPAHYLLDTLASVAERPKISLAQVAELKPQFVAASKLSVGDLCSTFFSEKLLVNLSFTF